jgi:hypothetical protein
MNNCPVCAQVLSDGSTRCDSCGTVTGAADSRNLSVLGRLAEEFTNAVRAGRNPSIEEYANRYPDLADRVRELFPALILLEGAAQGNAPLEQVSTKAPAPESMKTGSEPQRQRFVAGAILTGRYRIVNRLGKGGMGEVYRAEDLKLDQPVALKFLPEGLAFDGGALARLHREVSIARQVAHPNVCRVYDIGEMDGEHFLSMEYIDGEDLASLLRRIGRLPVDKATDIARQLCAGLAGIHEKDVLHRDIKPANIIIDGRGRARITDFGLAGLADQLRELSCAGTPAYMSPEQLQRGTLTPMTDIYALGLVLYEMFTGKRPFEAENINKPAGMRERQDPLPPSALVKDIDPWVDRIILRCLDKNPQARPSASRIAAAFAGGDPIAAALAAGETPSPEMVAATGGTEGFRPWLAWACLALVILGVGAAVFLGKQDSLVRRMPLEKPPEVLVERAREILRKAGYPEAPVDSAFGFETDYDYFEYVRSRDRSPSRWDRPPDSALQFWYRQSPRVLAREQMVQDEYFFIPGVTYFDPQPLYSGEASVWLDGRGRLISFEVLPPQMEQSATAEQAPDWSILFREAGLDPAEWVAVEPAWTPLLYADTRVAWRGSLPERPDIAMRIEAAAYRGKPVAWDLIGPWTRPSRVAAERPSAAEKTADFLNVAIVVALIGGGVFFARRNLHMRRVDRRGAGRLAGFVFALISIAWIFSEHHVPAPQGEIYLFLLFVSWALANSGLFWVFYISLEPFVRRHWPVSLISWSRLLSGSYRDPLVGRDLLVGCVLGSVWGLLNHLSYSVLHDPPSLHPPQLLTGVRAIMAVLSCSLVWSMFLGFVSLFLLFLLRVILRYQWAASAMFIVVLATTESLGSESLLLSWIVNALGWIVCLLALVRFGLLATVAGILFYILVSWFPITMQFSAWYSGIGLTGLVLLLGLAAYGFHTSMAGRSPDVLPL